jgi:hypothetical protein
MPAKPRLIGQAEASEDGSNSTLRQTVKEALLAVLADPAAAAAAKASAGRTLLEYFSEDRGTVARGAEMSGAELDAAIARMLPK